MLDAVVSCAVLASIPVSARQSELPTGVQAALDAWRGDYGATWQVFLDEDTLMGRMLYNGNADYPPIDPSTDKERLDLARALVLKAYGVFGLDDATLTDDRVKFLPLGMIGTTDKRTVRFRQEVGGVPVVGGSVSVLLNDADHVIAIHSQALPYMEGFDIFPSVDPADAATEAASAFFQETGVTAAYVGTPELKILPHYANELRAGALTWAVAVSAEDSAGLPMAYLYHVAAKQPMSVLERDDLVFNAFPEPQQQQGGIYVSVKANVTRGDDGDGIVEKFEDWIPDNGVNFEARPMPYMTVWRVLTPETRAFLTTTNKNGEFFLPGNLNGITVEVDFKGTYVDVCNMPVNERNFCTPCNNAPVSTVLQLGSNTIFINPGYDEVRVAQANVYYYLNFMRDWIRAVDPTDSTFDDGPDPGTVNQLPGEPTGQPAPYKARPNYDGGQFIDPCNLAMFRDFCAPMGGGPIYDFFEFSRSIPETACKNVAYATVIFHEMGHWLNELYGNGNRQPFGEGCADAWALYVADFPHMGTLTTPRSGDNPVMFCGDCPSVKAGASCTVCQGCHNGHHGNGQVLMGAFWKVRTRLKEFQGEELGAAIANSLFLAWMQAFDTDRILSVIEYQWLALDAGSDGVLENAPHKSEIDWGFLQQGFPGLQNPPFRYSCR